MKFAYTIDNKVAQTNVCRRFVALQHYTIVVYYDYMLVWSPLVQRWLIQDT